VVISEQRARWLADGSPPVPTLVINGAPHVLQHPSQAGLLLGLDVPPALRDAWQVAWDIDAVVEALLDVATRTSWDAMLGRVPGLERTALALVVDPLVGIAALPAAYSTGWFHWPGNPETGETGDAAVVAYEAGIVAAIADRDDLLAFARPVADAWRAFLAEHDQELRDEPDRPVRTPRGKLTLVGVLEAQRLHAAQHYRQATTFLASQGETVPALDLASLYGMRLPEAIY
jgi:hypothetical protein